LKKKISVAAATFMLWLALEIYCKVVFVLTIPFNGERLVLRPQNSVLFYVVFFYLLVLLIVKFATKVSLENVGFRLPEKGFGFFYALKGVGVFYGVIFALFFLGLNVAAYYFGYAPNIGTPSLQYYDNLQIKYMLVGAPMVEELIYRGVLIGLLGAVFGLRPWLILLSALLFALGHFTTGNASPENQIAGLLLGWVFYKSRSLLPVIILHFLGNLICVYAAYFEIMSHGLLNRIANVLIVVR